MNNMNAIVDVLYENQYNIAFGFAGLIASLVSYKAIDIQLKRSKYSHIPGPPTNGLA